MGDDPLNEIMSYLGFGDRPLAVGDIDSASNSSPAEDRLAMRGEFSLWRAENDSAEWIELRGPIVTFRATRAKATFLLTLLPVLRAWASGERPSIDENQLRVRIVQRHDGPKLEVRYRSWKPIRLCRQQARGFALFAAEIEAFAGS